MNFNATLNLYRKTYSYVHGLPATSETTHLLQCPVSTTTFRHTIQERKGLKGSCLEESLQRLQSESNGLISNILVHGSAGDHSSIDFSDLDATLLIPDNVIYSQSGLNNLKGYLKSKVLPFLYSYDRSQHHGFFLLWPELCKAYDEAILPPIVYTNAWALYPIDLEITSTCNNSKGRFENMLSKISTRIQSKRFWSPYTFKNLISHLLIIPSIYYTEQGLSLLKQNSFSLFCSEFPEYEVIYEFASKERSNWRQGRNFSTSPLIKFGYYFLQGQLPNLLSHLESKIVISDQNKSQLLTCIHSLHSRCHSNEN